ncbi:uncharacterized protein RCC_10129 [Ramularia collo-cygni]|uniref:NAD(P)-binding protein n=1 Tax=Ramularia collo-cygni TaxID=112498 RepID=A0A2D3VND4_9PEZI|nr:uncharacterized protein RCC_10129 [Ramularia collo-cygni]CZT24404.1 uncharacterized protein RCC_10129 [Ramularia collo-cygni]
MSDNPSAEATTTTPLSKIDFAASTALVTGGSSGIGHAIAQELVTRGVRRLILVAQTEEKLQAAAEALQASTRKIYKSKPSPSILEKEMLPPRSTSRFTRTSNVMVRAVVDMMLQFLPDMLARKSGGILNIGSTGGFQPVPFSAAYAASKAFVHTFSQAIRQENMARGVRVACVIPGVTETNLDGKGHGEKRGMIEMVGVDQPGKVAKVAVDALEENAAAKIVGWNNKAFHSVFNLLPDSVIASLVARSRGVPGSEGEA